MRTLTVPTIIALVSAGAAAHAMEIVPAIQKKPATSLAAVDAAVDAEQSVTVAGISVVPAGNLGSKDGKLQMHLKGLVAGSYDSNLFATETNVKDDVSARVVAGAEASYRVDDRIGVIAEVLADNQSFAQYTERNLMGGQARARGSYKGETTAGNLTLDYGLVDDPLVQTGTRIKRSVYGASTTWLREMLTGGVELSAEAHHTEYLEDDASFVAKDRNVTNYLAGARYIHQKNDRTALWTRVGYAADAYETSNRLKDVNAVSGAIGAEIGFGDRATVYGEVGVDSRQYESEFSAGYDDKEILAPMANIGLIYPVNDRGTQILARAYTEARNSFTSNAMQVTGLSVNGSHPISEKVTAVASLSALWLRDYGHAVGQDPSERQTAMGSLSAEYALRDGIVLRATGRYTQTEAKLANEADYNRFEGVIETAFAF